MNQENKVRTLVIHQLGVSLFNSFQFVYYDLSHTNIISLIWVQLIDVTL